MKIALAQQNYHIANFEYNLQKIKAAVQKAIDEKIDLIAFSELCICGYPPRDFLQSSDFIEDCYISINDLKPLSNHIGILVGAPVKNPLLEGKDLYNAAWFLYHGEVKHIAHKTLLPTYDVFDEDRHFEAGNKFDLLEFQGKKIAITICEDIWNIANENPLYPISPMEELVKHSPDFMINISASPFDYKHAHERLLQVKANALQYQLPVFYVNAVGAQTEIIFDGGSCVFNKRGEMCDELSYFLEETRAYDLDDLEKNKTSPPAEQPKDNVDLIKRALVFGIRDYFKKMNFKKAILGLSGGIDSALTLILAAEALGKENVLPVLLPSAYSSEHSISDSISLCKNLGMVYKQISIEDAYQTFLKTVEPHFNNLPFNVAEENIQARCRAVILMAIANKHGYILLNTTNKSEAAVGYGTLYGDMCGGLSVLGDVYKTQVYQLCKLINSSHEIIPQHILLKPPSAELRPNQKDSDTLPDYDLLDKILYRYIEEHKSASEIIKESFDSAIVNRVLQMVNSNEWKRHQMAPVLRVSPKAFGVGRRMPIVAKYI